MRYMSRIIGRETGRTAQSERKLFYRLLLHEMELILVQSNSKVMTEEDEDETYFPDFPPLFHYMRTLFWGRFKTFFLRGAIEIGKPNERSEL